MDTRLKSTEEAGKTRFKRTHPFAAWLCFSLGLIIVTGCLLSATALALAGEEGVHVLKAPFMDYRDTRFFKELTRFYFTFMYSLAGADSPGSAVAESNKEAAIRLLENEGENLLYGIADDSAVEGESPENGAVEGSAAEDDNVEEGAAAKGERPAITNIAGGLASVIGPDNMPVLPEGYRYCWYFDGRKVWVINEGTPVDTARLDSGYRDLVPNIAGESPEGGASGIRALLAVKDVLVESPYGHSWYFQDSGSCT